VDTREFGETITNTFGQDARRVELNTGAPFEFLNLDDVPFDITVLFEDVFEDLA